MNAGFSSLKKLKEQLLAEALRVDASYDAPILAIGTGIAGMFERHCNRKFERTENATFECSADRCQVVLDRYPVESVASVHLRASAIEGWVEQSGFYQNWNAKTGIVYWGWFAGESWAQLKFTFTGGYWWDITEEGNDTLPAGAVALPPDLLLAWQLQCRAAWQAIDKIGQDILKTGSSSNFVTGTLAGLELVPQVEAMIQPYRRFQLT
jgi:hypothetical protein